MDSESDSEFVDSFEKQPIPPTPILTRAKKKKIMNDLEDAVKTLADNIAKMGNHPPINLQPYSGKMDKRSFQSFIREFNKVGTAYRWRKEELCRNLPIFLKGEASAIYDGVADAKKNNWEDLVDEIAKNVGGSSVTYRRLINSRKQREGEGFSEFAQALSELSDRAFPDAEEYNADMRKNLLIDLFINGLDWKIREHLRRYDKPTSLSDAIALAMEEDQLQSDIKREELANNSLKLINNVNQHLEDWEACNVVNYGENFGQRFRPQSKRFFSRPYNFNPFNRNFYRPFNRGNLNYGGNNRNNMAHQENANYGGRTGFFNKNNNRQQNNFAYDSGNWRGNQRGLRRGFGRGRTRGRGGYRVNSVEANENQNSNNSTNAQCSNYLPILTIICILGIGFFPIAGSTLTGYQICNENAEAYVVAPPESYNCSVPISDEVFELEAQLIARRTLPITFQIFKCRKMISHVCTYSILKLYTNVPDNFTTWEKVSVEDCWKLVTDGILQDKILERKGNDIWKSRTEDIMLEYDWFGKNCNNTYAFVVERSIGAVMQAEDFIVSEFPELASAECKIFDNYCEVNNTIYIWKPPEKKALCAFQPVGLFPALVSDKYVVIEKFQATFVIKEIEKIPNEAKNCLPANTYAAENDVFLAFPKLKYFLQSGEKYIVPFFPDETTIDNGRNKRNTPRQPQRVILQAPPRAPGRVNATQITITTTTSPSTTTSPRINKVKALSTSSTTIITKNPQTTTMIQTTAKTPTATIKSTEMILIKATTKPSTTKSKAPTTKIPSIPTAISSTILLGSTKTIVFVP